MSLRTASDIASDVRTGHVTAEHVLAECRAAIASGDGEVRSFVRLFDDAAEAARQVDAQVAAGHDPGLLAGVPIAVKDNLVVANQPVTCGSRILEGFVSPFSATVVERLKAAGAVVVGHTNMDEFGMGSSCENSSFFATRNPWDLGRVPGGSSGGSAAAVAAGFLPLALGSDTGGSIRQPAALCGLVGLKPTYGRVSRYGLVAFASSLDQIGPLTRTVSDAALGLQVLAGADPRDATSSRVEVDDYQQGAGLEIEGLRIGIAPQFLGAELDPEVRENWEAAQHRLVDRGAEIVEVSLPSADAAVATYYVLANCEASANLARFDGMRYGKRFESQTAASLDDTYRHSRSTGFGTEVKRRILLGTFALSSGYYEAYYGKASAMARRLSGEFRVALDECDAVMTPTSPSAAFLLGEKSGDPLAMYLSDVFTTPASLAGLPALSVPSGLNRTGLPLAVQFIGRSFEEKLLLRLGAAVEADVGPIVPPWVAERS